MKGKILFVAGAAVGYVLGARAGRGAYVKIKDQAESLWENPTVQKGVQQAEGFVKENAPVVAKKAQDVANDAAHAVGSKAKSVSGKGSGATDKAAKATEAAHKAADKVDEKADDVKKQTSGTSPDDDKLPGVTVGE
ncbi:YtxH domain-containing protein [Frigoribacterium sp. 2355]